MIGKMKTSKTSVDEAMVIIIIMEFLRNINLLFSKEESVVGDEIKVLHSLNIDTK